MHRIRALRNPIRDYAWGSHHALAELQGRPSPSPGPEAELWMGAHPGAPSRVVLDGGSTQRLDRWIERDPLAALGPDVAARFEGSLPFLLKVLAAARPLSIQAHPSLAQARAGFAREEAAGVPPGAPHRCYRDANHKPELICALSTFEALCGFRPFDEIVEGIGAVGAPTLEAALAALRSAGDRDGLARFFGDVMSRDAEARRRLADEVAEGASHGDLDPRCAELVGDLVARHPGDPGVLAPLLLNVVTLAPGEALYLAAGELHAYLEGTGVEIMANSDNVLRGGLTAKHVDVPELLRTLTFAMGRPEVLRPEPLAPGIACYATPAPEFALSLLRVEAGAPLFRETHGPEILLCTEGRARVAGAAGEGLEVERGGSCWVPSSAGPYRLEGDAVFHAAGVGRLSRP